MTRAATADLARQLQDTLERAARDSEVPGVIASVHAPRLEFHWSAALPGPRSYSNDAWYPALPFRIASVTKLFTAAAVLRLVEDRRLALAAPMSMFASDELAQALLQGGLDPARITVSHLLTHTSGLPDHTHSPGFEQAVKDSPARVWSRLEQVSIAATLPRTHVAAGQRFEYSDTGYVVLGELIERVTGQALGTAVRALLGLDALGLARTHWERQEADPAPGERARQCMGDIDYACRHDPSFDLYGGGGLVSTTDDLCVFMNALLQGRVLRSTAALATGLLVPPAERAVDSYVHSRLAMVLPMGTTWGWGHLGYWGCGVVSCAELGITVAVTINQPHPATANLRRDLLAELAGLAVSTQLGRPAQPIRAASAE